ncbi:MAG: DUF4142 domain-containing protein [Ginsengibacter sp.]
MNTNQNTATLVAVSEKEFREGVMPRAQLSKLACEIALEKTTQKNVKEFAGWELMEATTVINVLKDLDTAAPAMSKDAEDFLKKLKGLNSNDFDKEFMAAELSNHEFLHDLAQDYIDGADDRSSEEQDIWHVANLALFAFTEHIGLCKRISGEVSAK